MNAVATKIERTPSLVPFPARGDSSLYESYNNDYEHPFDTRDYYESGIIELIYADVRYGFHVYCDAEIEGILRAACRNIKLNSDVIVEGSL